MKILVKWLKTPVVLVTLLVVFAVADLILVGRAYNLSKSDWAAWVGAIGTVGTLLGALWIANAQARSTEKAERTRAKLQAANMSTRLIHASGDLRRACETVHLDYPENPFAVFGVCDSMLKSIDVWSVDDVMPLIPLSGGVAVLLAHSADSIRSLHRVLALARISGELNSHEGRAEFIDGFCKQIDRVRKFVNDGQKGCEQAGLELLVEA